MSGFGASRRLGSARVAAGYRLLIFLSSRTVHGGNPLTRAGYVLALVSPLPSAAPEQDLGLRDLVSPLERALPVSLGRIEVRGGIRITYRDVLQLVLAKSPASRLAAPELPPNVHVGVPSHGPGVRC
jgi:hypothetical protein